MSHKMLWRGRSLCIATMHGKEQAIAPLMEKSFGFTCFTPDAFDTDSFGTFCGEKSRDHDPIQTAIHKCDAANALTGCGLVLASEGSFGPHPTLFFMPSDDEIIVLKDYLNDDTIVARHLSTNTNLKGITLEDIADLPPFLNEIGFPSHGVILKSHKDSPKSLRKGIQDQENLHAWVLESLESRGSCYLETDMRAMMNPTRMNNITQTTHTLIEKLHRTCPICDWPGFDVVQVIKGLPCSLCQFPTESVYSHRYECKKCFYELEKTFPFDKTTEDPRYCNVCNP